MNQDNKTENYEAFYLDGASISTLYNMEFQI